MAQDARPIASLLLVQIALVGAFNVPAPPMPHSHRAPSMCFSSPMLAACPNVLGTQLPSSMMGAQPRFVDDWSLAAAQAAAVARPQLPSGSTALARSTLAGATALLVLVNAYQVGVTFAPSWALLVHACAGALGGIAALLTDSAVFGRFREAMTALKFTAITKAINSVTYVSLSQAVASAVAGLGGVAVVAGVALAAAGTGITATLAQSLFTQGSRKGFVVENVVGNVAMFEAYWLTWAGISSVFPTLTVSLAGVAAAGAACGLVSSVAKAIVGFKFSWRAFRNAVRRVDSARDALSSGILFVVYQGIQNIFA